jgi:ribonuclease BN (tRNA processing enzyme)
VFKAVGSVLDRISTLSNLEYLDLSHSDHLLDLPDSFSSLQKLHTLDLTGCWELTNLPANMGYTYKSFRSCMHDSLTIHSREAYTTWLYSSIVVVLTYSGTIVVILIKTETC